MKKKFAGIIERWPGAVYGHNVIVPDDIVRAFKKNGISRLVVTFNGEVKIHCAFTSTGDGQFFIHVNKDVQKKLGLALGSKIKVEVEEDTSKYGMAMPECFEVLLEQDPEGSDYFHALTAGKQRSLIYVIGKPKSEAKQLQKAIVILDFLKWNKGILDFKLLNEAFKAANRKG
ncbi:MAG: DUF1905 domain-containing protein [Saprospiraceae bacterium]|nr:DUF1905 domain-containing protein [Saprospiraceae bacterium]